MKKSFENWQWEDVETSFWLERADALPILQGWEKAPLPPLEAEQAKTLRKLGNLLEHHHQDWNEEELKLNFIAPLLALVDYHENDHAYQPFAERILKAEIGDWEVGGTVDWLLAAGKQSPKKPFFFLHEYKRTKMGDSDPLGQLLIAMLVAQKNNEKQDTVFGAYIIGKDWYFVVLSGSKYAVAQPSQAIEANGLEQITAMLFEIKNLATQYIFKP